MNILISNDDGVYSEGIYTLALMLFEKGHKVIVVAPDGNRSAYSHSLTIHKEVIFKKVNISDKFEAYSLSGTPADCVKFALHYFKDIKFDLICAGINHGTNLGTDALYSGTISAGSEGNALGYKSMAFSCTNFSDINWSVAKEVCAVTFDKYVDCLDPSYTLSINFKSANSFAEYKGIKVTKLGIQLYSDSYEPTGNEGGYRLIGEPIEHCNNDEDCDVEWNLKNYITVTPVLCNRTGYEAIEKIKKQKGE